MDIFLLIFCFILMLAVLYLLLGRKVAHLTDRIFKEHYKTQFRQDMAEFYREMENYGILFENKIQQFKKLLDRQANQIQIWRTVLSKVKTTKKAKEAIEEVNSMIERGVFINSVPLKAQPPEKTREKEKPEETKATDTPSIAKTDPTYDKEKDDRIAEQVIDDLLSKEKSVAHPDKEDGRGDFSNILEHQLGSEREDEKNSAHQVPQPTQTKNLDTGGLDELETNGLLPLLQDLSDNKKKPKALQILLNQGYKISEISNMAEIPHSDLETTKDIYSLRAKESES